MQLDRPRFFARIQHLTIAFFLVATITGSNPARAENFSTFVEGMWPDAWKRFITRKTFDQATKGLTVNNKFDRLTKKQPEFSSPIGKYIKKRVNLSRIQSGKKKTKQYSRLLKKIKTKTGVDPYIVAAIWGLETSYGGYSGKSDVFRSLATLAYKRYRGDFFRAQFIDALVIMQKERIPRKNMIGSWAGAMGQTQFIPSSFLAHAVDFNRDGRRDLWKSVPDALGSTANYLLKNGWKTGIPWGYPVKLTRKTPLIAYRRSWKYWRKAGVKRMDRGKFPMAGEATLFFPSGEGGPAFLVTENYETIKSYNFSDAYAISVAMIADRLRGMGAVKQVWPTRLPLTKSQRMKVQTLMVKKGLKVPNRVGKISQEMRNAIRDYQLRQKNKTADGHPDAGLLKQLSR